MPSIRRSIATSRGNSRRASGSPPVSRTSVIPEPREDPDQALDLLEAEQVGAVEPVHPLGRHAVATAEVAAVGDRDPQVGDRPPVGVEERLHPTEDTRGRDQPSAPGL